MSPVKAGQFVEVRQCMIGEYQKLPTLNSTRNTLVIVGLNLFLFFNNYSYDYLYVY